jgi:hypothetical protein
MTVLDRVTTPKKKNSHLHPWHADWPICGPPSSFSPTLNQRSSGQSQTTVDGRLLGLSGPYHRHAIDTFNTCSRGPTHRSLTNTGGGYNPEGASFPHTTPRSSWLTISTFHLRAPPGLQFNHNLPKSQIEFKGPMTSMWSSDHSTIYHVLHLRLAMAINLCLAIGFTRIDQKVVLMQLGYQSNSYNQMHIQDS